MKKTFFVILSIFFIGSVGSAITFNFNFDNIKNISIFYCLGLVLTIISVSLANLITMKNKIIKSVIRGLVSTSITMFFMIILSTIPYFIEDITLLFKTALGIGIIIGFISCLIVFFWFTLGSIFSFLTAEYIFREKKFTFKTRKRKRKQRKNKFSPKQI